MNKRLLVPRFLQELDDKLLRNKPGTWAARTHLVIYFAFLFALLTAAFCYFVFFDAKQDSNIVSWNVFVGLIAFIGFVFWLIFLLRFNVFKRYGNRFAIDSLKDFSLYFIAIGAMTGVCFVPSAVETYRANQQFGNEEIVNDINELNVSACKLEYGLLPFTWEPDTFRVVPKLPNSPVNEETTVVVETDTVLSEEPGDVTYKYELIDTADLRIKIMGADSLLKINDTMYVFYDCPDYTFVSSYAADEYTTAKLLSSVDIYYNTIKNYVQPDRTALLKRMEEFRVKYAVSSPYEYGDFYDNNEKARYDNKIRKKYDLSRISNGIDNVVMKKYDWVKNWDDYLRVFYYITLVFTLLVFIFRHSTVKTFFLSVLTGVLLSIITALIMAVSYSRGSSVLSFMIFYYAVFIVLALSIFGVRVRKAVQGIGLNLFVFMTAFIPWIFVALNKDMKEPRSYVEGLTFKPINWSLYFLLAEIAGTVILLILVHTLFKKLYRRWYAAPEE